MSKLKKIWLQYNAVQINIFNPHEPTAKLDHLTEIIDRKQMIQKIQDCLFFLFFK